MISLNDNVVIKSRLCATDDSNDIITNEEGSIICVKTPRVYDTVKTQVSERYIENYFNDILNNDCRVTFINGIQIDGGYIMCDVLCEFT